MSKWDKISLFKFQQIDLINNKPEVTDIDKTLFSTCIVFGYTEFELDNLPIKKVDKLSKKMAGIFNTPFESKPFKRIGKYFINYDISKVTFGQYVELSFFAGKPLQNAHFILSSLSNLLFRRNNSATHRNRAEYFLKQSVNKVLGSVSLIIESLDNFNKEYSSLFGLDKAVAGEVQEDKFNKRYGWIYSASQVAEYERITNEQAFRLPVRQALNDLAYLKAKGIYEAEQLKKQTNGR